jgi:hypothetical protein
MGAHGSVGRALRSHRRGLWFESRCAHKNQLTIKNPTHEPELSSVQGCPVLNVLLGQS